MNLVDDFCQRSPCRWPTSILDPLQEEKPQSVATLARTSDRSRVCFFFQVVARWQLVNVFLALSKLVLPDVTVLKEFSKKGYIHLSELLKYRFQHCHLDLRMNA